MDKRFLKIARRLVASGGKIQIYVASLKDYNEGRHTGEWIDIDGIDGDEILSAIGKFLDKRSKATGEVHEEWAIHDTDGVPYHLDDNPDLDQLGEFCSAPEGMRDAFGKFLDYHGGSGIAFSEFEEAFIGEFESGEEFVRQNEGDAIEKKLRELDTYFDYERYAEDLFVNDYLDLDAGNRRIYVFTRR